MSTITKGVARTMIQQMFDDPSAKRWTAPNLDQLTELIIDQIWSDILDMAPYFNTQYDQINLPLHVPGFIDLRPIADGGDLSQRLYRVQQVIADGRQYFPKDPRDYLMVAQQFTGDVTTIKADTGVEQRFSYQFLGNQMWLHPLGQVTTFVELRYNYRPARFTSLADGASVVFPDGSELAYILQAAGTAMLKGAAEEATPILAEAERARLRLMNTIRRQYHGMMQPFAPQNAWEWGST